jgi:Fic family protein
MTSSEEITVRLDKIATLLQQGLDRNAALLQLAHRDAIERARMSIRADKVNAAILSATAKLTPAGKVTAEVKRKTGQSPATINRRIGTLIEQGAVEKHGAGPATQYKATGLV